MKFALITTLFCLSSLSLMAQPPIEGICNNPALSSEAVLIWEDERVWAPSGQTRPAPGVQSFSPEGGDSADFRVVVRRMLSAGTVTLGNLSVDTFTVAHPTPFLEELFAGVRRSDPFVILEPRVLVFKSRPNAVNPNPPATISLTLNPTNNQFIDLSGFISLESPLTIFTTTNPRRENFIATTTNARTVLNIRGAINGNSHGITFNGGDRTEIHLSAFTFNMGDWVINQGTLFLNGAQNVNNPVTTINSNLVINPTARVITQQRNQFGDNVVVTVNRNGTLDLGGFSHRMHSLIVTGSVIGRGNLSLAPNSLMIGEGGLVNLNNLDVSPLFASSESPFNVGIHGGTLEADNIVTPTALFFAIDRGGILGSPDRTLNINTNGHEVLIQVDQTTTKIHGPDATITNVHYDAPVIANGIGTLLITGQDDLMLIEADGARLEIEIGEAPTDIVTLHQAIFDNHHCDTLDGHGDAIITALDGSTGTLLNHGVIQPGDTRRPGTLILEAHLEEKCDATAVFTMEHCNSSQLIVKNGHVNLDGALVFTGCQIEIPVGCERILIDNRCGEGIRGNFRCFVDRLSDNVMGNPHLSADGMTYLLGIAASPQAGIGGAIQTLNFGVTQETLIAAERTWEIRPWPASTSEALTASNGQIEAGKFWEKPSNHPATIYIAPLGNWGTIKRNGTQRGLDFNSVGGLIGGDYAFERVGVGAFIGSDRIKGTVDESYGNFRVQSLFGQAYGTFVLTPDRNLFLDLTLGGMRNWFTFNRQTSCTIARGKPNGWTYDGYAGLGYNLTVKKEWRLTPIVGIQYIRSKIDDFCETDAGVENLCVDDFKKHFLRSWLGATFGGKLERNRVIWMPQIHVYWQHEFTDLSRCLAVANPCLNTCKNLGIATSDRNYGIMGADLSVIFGNNYNWIVTGAYDYFLSRKAKVNNMYGKLGYNF